MKINECRKGAKYFYLCFGFPASHIRVKKLGYKKFRRVLWNLGDRFVWGGWEKLDKRVHCAVPWATNAQYKEWQERYKSPK